VGGVDVRPRRQVNVGHGGVDRRQVPLVARAHLAVPALATRLGALDPLPEFRGHPGELRLLVDRDDGHVKRRHLGDLVARGHGDGDAVVPRHPLAVEPPDDHLAEVRAEPEDVPLAHAAGHLAAVHLVVEDVEHLRLRGGVLVQPLQ